MLTTESSITGVQVNYYFICKTKLWLFSHCTTMEHTSDTVHLGSLIHEKSYKGTEQVSIGRISIDFVEKGDKMILHEVKKSKSMEKAHSYQLLYYLYDLGRRGINAEGVINYPLMRKKESIILTPETEKDIEKILEDIKEIVEREIPPKPEKKKYCRKCSYFELCWVV